MCGRPESGHHQSPDRPSSREWREARRGTAANITHLDTETQSVPSPTLGRTHGPVPGVLTLSSPRPTRGRETFPRDLSDDIMQGDTDISAQADIMIHVVYVW